MTPTIRDLKVYTPARDFEMSKRFYAALGFEMTSGWGGTVDCRLGGAVFRLQNYYVKDWAENFMMLFGVEDAEPGTDMQRPPSTAGNLAVPAYPNPKRPAGPRSATYGTPRAYF